MPLSRRPRRWRTTNMDISLLECIKNILVGERATPQG